MEGRQRIVGTVALAGMALAVAAAPAASRPSRAKDHYLGFRYRRVTATDAPFASEWGLRTQLNDLRRVVERARRGGRDVILGGHSAGASTAVAYANHLGPISAAPERNRFLKTVVPFLRR